MGKYDLLSDYLAKKSNERITLCMQEIEDIIKDKLPESAYKYSAWWANSRTKQHPYCRIWIENNYRTVDVKTTIHNQMITFEKI